MANAFLIKPRAAMDQRVNDDNMFAFIALEYHSIHIHSINMGLIEFPSEIAAPIEIDLSLADKHIAALIRSGTVKAAKLSFGVPVKRLLALAENSIDYP